MLKLIASLLVILWTTSAHGDVADAVVMVDGCSGVCVDPAGLVLTVKHCNLPETVTVRFKERSVTATRIYVCREMEGPVVYDCEGDGYPHLPVSGSAPRIGERLWSYGYPHINNRRELRWANGPLLRWSTFEYGGGSFNGNVVRFGTCPGWSGGPLLNAKGEVCGLLNSTDCRTSVFVSSASVRDAYATTRPRVEPTQPAIADGRPKLYVFGSMSCTPCRRFKDDYGTGSDLRRTLDATFAVEFVDINKQADLAQRFGVSEVPTFLVPGRDPIVGYEGADQLLIALGLRREIGSRHPPQRQVAPTDPKPVVVPPTATTPETPPVPETLATQSEPAPVSTPVATSEPAAPNSDAMDRMSGLVEKAVTLATWLGVGGMTGGAGGLVLGGIALWRTLRKRKRRERTGRDPPRAEPPPMVTVDSPPPPQAIVPETRFAPYERDTFAEAFAWSEAELARKYPGSVGTLESLRGLIDQYLAAKGVKRSSARP
jgi:thiol-disulfide isomerase/thioredoxin